MALGHLNALAAATDFGSVQKVNIWKHIISTVGQVRWGVQLKAGIGPRLDGDMSENVLMQGWEEFLWTECLTCQQNCFHLNLS